MLFILRYLLKRDTFSVVRSSYSASRCSSTPQNRRMQHHNQLHSAIRPSPLVWSSFQLLHNYQQRRGKAKKTGRRDQRSGVSDEGLEDDEIQDEPAEAYEEMLDDKHSRTIRVTVNSMRADLLLKAGLGIARNKVEALFYDSKIRVNGRKLLKKSAQLDVQDEIDVLRGPSPTNPDHLVVSRVEIVSVTPRTENLSVSLRRHKSLIIENYTENGSYDDGQEK